MKTLIEDRLTELKTEFQKGKERLSELEKESRNVEEAMLRISGAIQILEELLASNQSDTETKKRQTNGVVEGV
ncbi:hypothetical protein [Flavilitoribacter nigricans]|uniref:Uncharacterized protein n=1 Tax=Flavilitoribacter nigricans (strain ATCC 23147 / DSM 23189 / NBRC 102662 / NCIMB 1420 / SS-2) TaxID=1122177 RepID=A0A2D0N0B2_FLAN2|nr:hypothetical protein [Flavilitoribacter nigricans]PHN01992.1 hypothetical protein CRP01_34365 [Flavilitoribacter nigricans DSM 23189 = NBRC 102662]